MSEHRTIRLRLGEVDVEAFERGVSCERVRLAKGQDGIYEIELFGAKPADLPEHSSKPAVPLAKDQTPR